MKPSSDSVFLNIKDIHTIGFIYNIATPSYEEDLNMISTILDRVGVLYFGLAIETKRGLVPQTESVDDIPDSIKTLEDKGITIVEKLHLDWIGVPNSSKIDDFCKKEYDLFISFNDNGDFTLEYVLRGIKAKLLIGMHNYPDNPCALVLEGENKSTLSYRDFLEQIFHYLNTIKAVRGNI